MKLRVTSQSCEPFDIEPSSEEIFIGRSSSCDLVIPHQGISRRHVRLFMKNQVWMVQDLGSTNATYLGEFRLEHDAMKLNNGDVIRLAPSKSDYTITILEVETGNYFSDPASQTVTQLASSLLDEMNKPLVEHSGAEVLRHHAQRLMMLSQANGNLARAGDREDLAERLLDQVFNLIEADAAAIYLDQPGIGYKIFAARPEGVVPPLSQTLIKEVTGPGMALYANDLAMHQALSHSHSLAGSNLHALVASPLFEENTIYGIAVAYSFNMANSFDDSHMKMLVGLAAAASMRLHNIILTEEAAKRLQENNRRLEEEVALRTQELRQKNMQILSSMDYARHIQEAILPRPERLAEMFPEAFMFNLPRDIVSGDFYWCGLAGEQVMVALVDCTGHGVPGAFMSMIGYTLLNKIVNEQKITDPAQVLERLNQEVRVALKQEGTSIRATDGMEMGLCLVDTSTRTLSFAGSRFDLYLCRPNARLKILKGNRQSIGGKLRRHFSGFDNQTVTLEPDERVFMFTDGFADQPGANGKRLGRKSLKDLLQNLTNCGLSMADVGNDLLDFLKKHRAGTVQRDDISALGFTFVEGTLV